MIKSKSINALLAVVFSAFLFNCTPKYNPAKIYPDFKQQYRSFESVKSVTDVLIFENRDGRPLDYDRQVSVAKAFSEEFRELMVSRDLVIDTTSYLSSGLFLADGSNALIIDSIQDSVVVDSGVVMYAPFYLSDALQNEPLFKEEILMAAVDTLLWDKPSEPNYIPTDALFVFAIDGINTTIGKQFGQAMLTGALTLGNAYGYQTSHLHGELYVFDSHTGKLLWKDIQYLRVNLANENTARQFARLFANRLHRINEYRP
ncbi:MAG: hypothetical protein NXI08_14570 [bacterium]|nr:hypothetical protein [bacterium]